MRDELVQGWIARERMTRMRQLGETFMAAVRGGQPFAAAARANRFNIVVSSRPITRADAAGIPARGLPAQIFAGQQGAVLSDIRADGGAVLVATIEQINRVDTSAVPQAVEAARVQFQQGLMGSFGEAVQQQIVDRARVRRNEDLLNSQFRGSDAEDEAAAQ